VPPEPKKPNLPAPEASRPFLRTVGKCAQAFGINRKLLSRLLRDGVIPTVRLHPAGERMVDDRDVVAYIDAAKVRRP